MALSSRGLGHGPFKAATRVRIPSGSLSSAAPVQTGAVFVYRPAAFSLRFYAELQSRSHAFGFAEATRYDAAMKHHLQVFHHVIASLVFLCAGGCSTFSAMNHFSRPSVVVNGMSVRNVSANGFTMVFDLDVQNSNAVPIPVVSADYKLGLAGAQLLKGTIEPKGSLPASGTRKLAVPVEITFESLLAVVEGLKTAGTEIPYSLEGGLSFDSGVPLIGQVRTPITFAGVLKLRDLLSDPMLLLKSGTVRKLAESLLHSATGR